jgi:hypothetical protein
MIFIVQWPQAAFSSIHGTGRNETRVLHVPAQPRRRGGERAVGMAEVGELIMAA